MGVTDELKEYAEGCYGGSRTRLKAIADRIDEAHEQILTETLQKASERAMMLPRDADGIPIHVGDWIYWHVGHKAKVVAVTSDDVYWWEDDGCHWCHAVEVRHYHKPTVEDVMEEFAIDWECAQDGEDKAAVLKEYSAKLRLAEEDKPDLHWRGYI